MILLAIALGGAAGAVARYGLGSWIQGRAGSGFPIGTLAVNVLGSFLLGFFLHYVEGIRSTPEVRALVSVGILGAFTTFSTFSYEVVALLESGAWPRAIGYVLGSLLLGVAAVVFGAAAANHFMALRS